MPYLLDSNVFRLALIEDDRIIRRLAALPEEETVWVSVIAFREKLAGILRVVTDAEGGKGRTTLPLAYDYLARFAEQIPYYPVLPFSPEADALFRSWGNWVNAVGKNDCRIAASAVTGGLVVVTADGDFARIHERVPELRHEDWSAPL